MKSKVLIVDDEKSIRVGFKAHLSEEGFEVITAKDFDSAVKIIDSSDPDLIIADIILGGHTGIDLLSEVKKRGLICPVIIITGEPNIDTSAEAVRLGAFDYIPKPVQNIPPFPPHRRGEKRLRLEWRGAPLNARSVDGSVHPRQGRWNRGS